MANDNRQNNSPRNGKGKPPFRQQGQAPQHGAPQTNQFRNNTHRIRTYHVPSQNPGGYTSPRPSSQGSTAAFLPVPGAPGTFAAEKQGTIPPRRPRAFSPYAQTPNRNFINRNQQRRPYSPQQGRPQQGRPQPTNPTAPVNIQMPTSAPAVVSSTSRPPQTLQQNTSSSSRNAQNGKRRGGRSSSRQQRRPSGPPTHTPAKQPEIPIAAPSENTIRIIPLGGVEEIGRNMTVIEYGNDIIIVDAGLQFATDQTPGVDYLLPNTAYLEERKSKIRAIVITHGHLDHIGALPYLIERLGNPPIYCREFGAMLIRKRNEEFTHLPPLNLKVIGKDDGFFPITPAIKIKFFGLTHSIPDSSGIIIETPHGDLVFTGDVRVENKAGVPDEREVAQYAVLKDRNLLLLAMDSTGIEKPGWSLSETVVVDSVDKIVNASGGRILIATFASQVERIIAFIEIARKYGRKVAIGGRSMKSNVEIIKKLRLSEVKHAIPIEEINDYAPNKIMVLATGAQGEEFASLMRMATGTHKQIKLSRSDTVILSSSVIPGNERAVTALKDNLFRHDAKVITYYDSDVHTSGHGKRAELEWIHRQIPYRFFMPVHGHHFMLKMHADLSRSLGHAPENIIIPDNGSVIEIFDKGTKIRKLNAKMPSAPLTVDGFAIGDIQDVVIRDRQMLAEEGMFVIVASVNSQTGKLRKSPDIISRGFVYLRESQDLLRDVRELVKQVIETTASGQRPIDFDNVRTVVTDEISRFLLQKTAKRPIVIPVILGF